MHYLIINIELSIPKENQLVQGGNSGKLIAKPELKIFFVLLIFRYGLAEIRDQSVESLAKELGVSKTSVVDGMSMLSDAGFYLKSLKRVNPNTGKGRPKCAYCPTEKLKKLLSDELAGKPYWGILIDDLLSDCAKPKSQQIYPLKLANRLLLITLLMHADKSAKVKLLGYAQVLKLTGMTKQQLASQRKKLWQLGYLNGYQCGGLIKKNGKLVKHISCYDMNVSRSKYPTVTVPPQSFIFSIPREISPLALISYALEVTDADALILPHTAPLRNQKAENDLIIARENFDSLIGYPRAWICCEFFVETFNVWANLEYLKVSIYKYASYILSQHWIRFSERAPHHSVLDNLCSLQQMISNDFSTLFPTKKNSNHLMVQQVDSSEIFKAFFETILTASYNLATYIYLEVKVYLKHLVTSPPRKLTIEPIGEKRSLLLTVTIWNDM